MGHILHRNVTIAPCEENHGVDEECEQEIEQYAANHHEKPLPSGLSAELPRLCGLFHLLRVEALVYHARYLAVSAEWQPAHTIGCVAVLWLELEQMEPGVEEKEEFLYSYAKKLGKKEVASLMYED